MRERGAIATCTVDTDEEALLEKLLEASLEKQKQSLYGDTITSVYKYGVELSSRCMQSSTICIDCTQDASG
eukprot:3948332-Pleurochrysis_carterae.AAC.1